MNVSERLAASAVVPVVVLDDAKDAVATAKALLAGGVDVMEITFRTALRPGLDQGSRGKVPRHVSWRRNGHYA